MKKYFKFLPIMGLVLFVLLHLIYARPRSVENILGISSNTVFNFCNVEVTDWNGAILDSKNAELTQLEFNHVIEMMSHNKYCKTWGKNDYTSDDGSYYDFTLSYSMSGNKDRQRITITKDGYIYTNGDWYHVSSGEDKEMIHGIYEYICEVIEENIDENNKTVNLDQENMVNKIDNNDENNKEKDILDNTEVLNSSEDDDNLEANIEILGEMDEDNYNENDVIGNPSIFLNKDTIIANEDSVNNRNFFYYKKTNRYSSINSTDDYYRQDYDNYNGIELSEIKSNGQLNYIDVHNQVKNIEDTINTSNKIKEPFQEFDYSNELIAYTQASTNNLVQLIDGQKKVLTQFPVEDIRVIDDAIYYYDKSKLLYRYKSGEEIKITENIPSDFQVIEDYIYYIDSNQDLYRFNIHTTEKNFISHETGLLASDNHNVYYLKGNISYSCCYNCELYMINNTDEKGNFMRVVDLVFVNVLFVRNNKVFFGGIDRGFTVFSSIEPEKEKFSDIVLYENDEIIIYYVGFICYEEGDSNIIIYDKKNHVIVDKIIEWMTPESQLVGTWLYIRSEEANIYRINIDTLEIQKVYEGIRWGFDGALNYIVIDNNNLVISQPMYKDDDYYIEILSYNMETKQTEVLPIQGQVIYRDWDVIYYVDEALFTYDLVTKVSTNICDYTCTEVIYDNEDYLYLVEKYVAGGSLIRIKKGDYSFSVLTNDSAETSGWIIINEDVYYVNNSNELVKLNLTDSSKKVIANNCRYIISKKISEEGTYLGYETQDGIMEVIKILE